MYKISSACMCKIGNIRHNNEDNFLFINKYLNEFNSGLKSTLKSIINSNTPRVFCVFDGIGGLNYGEKAAFTAAKYLSNILDELPSNESEFFEALKQFILNTNELICSQAIEQNSQMGTTISALIFFANKVYVCNVGDSRSYLLRNNILTQISVDHTDMNIIQQYNIHNRRPRLTQYLGLYDDDVLLEPQISSFEIKSKDIYMLCTDGLTDFVLEAEIQTILQSTSNPSKITKALTALALNNGGKDNITIICSNIK